MSDGRTVLTLEIVAHPESPVEVLEFRIKYDDADFWMVVAALGQLSRDITQQGMTGWIRRGE